MFSEESSSKEILHELYNNVIFHMYKLDMDGSQHYTEAILTHYSRTWHMHYSFK